MAGVIAALGAVLLDMEDDKGSPPPADVAALNGEYDGWFFS